MKEVQHGSARQQERVLVVDEGVFESFRAAHLPLISSFIEVGGCIEHQALYGYQNLKHARLCRVPNFGAFPGPCVEEAEAHIACLVQVWVQSQSTGVIKCNLQQLKFRVGTIHRFETDCM